MSLFCDFALSLRNSRDMRLFAESFEITKTVNFLIFWLLSKEAVALVENYFCSFHPTSSKWWKRNKDYCCNVYKLPNTPLHILLYWKWIPIFYGVTLFKLLLWGCQLHISKTDSTLSLFNSLPFLQLFFFKSGSQKQTKAYIHLCFSVHVLLCKRPIRNLENYSVVICKKHL